MSFVFTLLRLLLQDGKVGLETIQSHICLNTGQKGIELGQAILDIFDRYDTSFVDNEAFLDWTTADWPETWAAKNDPNAQEPELNWSMQNRFVSSPNGAGVPPVDTL